MDDFLQQFDPEAQAVMTTHSRVFSRDMRNPANLPGAVLVLIDMREHRTGAPHKATVVDGIERYLEVGMFEFVEERYADVPMSDRHFMILYPAATAETLASNPQLVASPRGSLAKELSEHDVSRSSWFDRQH